MAKKREARTARDPQLSRKPEDELEQRLTRLEARLAHVEVTLLHVGILSNSRLTGLMQWECPASAPAQPASRSEEKRKTLSAAAAPPRFSVGDHVRIIETAFCGGCEGVIIEDLAHGPFPLKVRVTLAPGVTIDDFYAEWQLIPV